MKKYIIYIISVLFIIFIYTCKFYRVNYNLDTAFDEGYFYLLLWKIQHGINTEGISQWPLIVHGILGNDYCLNISYLRYLNLSLNILSSIIFFVLAGITLIKQQIIQSKTQMLQFFIIVCFISSFSISNTIISYNSLQQCFVSIIIGCFLMASYIRSSKLILLYILIGFISFWSIITILPSGLLLIISIIILIWIQHFHDKKNILFKTVFILSGFLLSIVLCHFFICDVSIILNNTLNTAHVITGKSGWFHYSSYLTQYTLYFKDSYINLSLLLGLGVFCLFISNLSKNWIGKIIYISSLCLFLMYQKKPQLPLSTLLMFFIFLWTALIIKDTKEKSLKEILSYSSILNIFLFFSPLIASLGTNNYLGDKMIVFIIPWSYIIIKIKYNKCIYEKYANLSNFVLVAILFVSVIPIFYQIYNLRNNSNATNYFTKEKPISRIHITQRQKQYFESVYNILNQYHYKSGTDIIFSTQLDHMTICALDAIPCDTYFWPKDFILDPGKHKLKKPDFLFLNTFDLTIMSDSLKTLNWGFPEAFNCYYVGSPETLNTGYSTERWLYCSKNRKNQLLK